MNELCQQVTSLELYMVIFNLLHGFYLWTYLTSIPPGMLGAVWRIRHTVRKSPSCFAF